MFEFYWPWMALLLVLPFLIRLFWQRPKSEEQALTEGNQTTLLHPSLAHLQEAFQTRRPGTPISALLYRILLSLLWISLVLALMRPQWLEPYTENRTAGYDLMLAVDASHSMDALDFTVKGKQVSRMQVVKGVVGKFIDGRKGDRIGLVIFGSQAYVLSPLSFDRRAVSSLLNDVIPTIAGNGTAMGDALGLGVKKLRDRPEGSRVLLLIADGENTAGTIPPLKAAQLAAREGIRIYSIGVGSDREEVPIMENGRLIYRSDLGFNEEVMRQIAETSGGAYFRGTDTAALEKIYQRIDELEKTEAESRTIFIPQPLYHWPLGIGLICLLVMGLFPEGRKRTLKGGGYA
ncbi:MAG: VWA domain-containing protein [gamma proteobacterium endosymbiont of Lamellibrachia anaximandri]|nr:VWA domain-containing protein [gamma proteobacterium endosymbiont of Lamellibrachia anaximandri]MBL3619172.1 VWA domain-containing protein [gamma proteobacterium endosymbiont of Lamellibrachia anaximandri]